MFIALQGLKKHVNIVGENLK